MNNVSLANHKNIEDAFSIINLYINLKLINFLNTIY